MDKWVWIMVYIYEQAEMNTLPQLVVQFPFPNPNKTVNRTEKHNSWFIWQDHPRAQLKTLQLLKRYGMSFPYLEDYPKEAQLVCWWNDDSDTKWNVRESKEQLMSSLSSLLFFHRPRGHYSRPYHDSTTKCSFFYTLHL